MRVQFAVRAHEPRFGSRLEVRDALALPLERVQGFADAEGIAFDEGDRVTVTRQSQRGCQAGDAGTEDDDGAWTRSHPTIITLAVSGVERTDS